VLAVSVRLVVSSRQAAFGYSSIVVRRRGRDGVVQQQRLSTIATASGVRSSVTRPTLAFARRPRRSAAAASLASFRAYYVHSTLQLHLDTANSHRARSHARATRTAGRLHFLASGRLECLHHPSHLWHHRLPRLGYIRHCGC
jgi:hypothetical protein